MATTPNPASHEKHRLASADRKTAIVETAIRLFAEKGFRGTTTREIAAACGVSEPVLYQHFATKRDLYNAIIDAQSQQGMEPFERKIEPYLAGNDDFGFLTALGELILDWHAQDPGAMRLLLFSALEGSELTQMFVERHADVFLSKFSGYLGRRMEEGGLRRMNPGLAARAFIGMIGHYAMDRQIFGMRVEDVSDSEVVETMVGIYLRGMQV
ncbi:MAG: TetR/AcrR family transcriptional regulator [Bryobacteraceae bacterium]